MMLLSAAPTWATVVSYSGDLELISDPESLARKGLVNDRRARLIEENAFYLLPRDTYVDIESPGVFDQWRDLPPHRPSLAAGSLVNSYLVHADSGGRSVVFEGSITFDAAVLGLIVRQRTLRQTNETFGDPDIQYPKIHAGLELGLHRDWVTLSEDRLTVSWHFTTRHGIDQLRIIEDPIPEPATWILTAAGLVSSILLRRRMRTIAGAEPPPARDHTRSR